MWNSCALDICHIDEAGFLESALSFEGEWQLGKKASGCISSCFNGSV
jgi:hypothetical protein